MERAAGYTGGRHSHRIVLIVMNLRTQEFRPSVGELMELVSWMLGGMYYQEDETRAKRHKNKTSRPHKSSTLEAEAHVPPLSLYLDSMVAQATKRLEDSGMAAKIEGHAKRFAATCGRVARTSGSTSLSMSTLGCCPGAGSLNGLRVARQPGCSGPSGRASGGPEGCPGGSFTHDSRGEATWDFTGDLPRPAALS